MTTKSWFYLKDGIWFDTRNLWWLNIVKTLNLSCRVFTNGNLQSRARALTYSTALAIVPALALLFAIGKGFGFQHILQAELSKVLTGQQQTTDMLLALADHYLDQSSEGVFLGIGIVFLLWTMISLLSNIEKAFNTVFAVKHARTFWRKTTDYTALLLILPVLLICAGGLSVFVSNSLQSLFSFKFMTPVVTFILTAGSWILTWTFFSAMFFLIPNTKVRLSNAILGGILSGTVFKILQWLFVSGQLYVTKYNAIYGGFSFIPLLLIWLYLTWMTILCGALICYASQNISMYAFISQAQDISTKYRDKIALLTMAVITRRFIDEMPDLSLRQLSKSTGVPARIQSDVLDDLQKSGLLVQTATDALREDPAYIPAIEASKITAGLVLTRLADVGKSRFLPAFDRRATAVDKIYASIMNHDGPGASNIPVSAICLKPPKEKQKRPVNKEPYN